MSRGHRHCSNETLRSGSRVYKALSHTSALPSTMNHYLTRLTRFHKVTVFNSLTKLVHAIALRPREFVETRNLLLLR